MQGALARTHRLAGLLGWDRSSDSVALDRRSTATLLAIADPDLFTLADTF